MSVYTKTGDDGTTSLYEGKRLLKSDWQIEASGSIDELTSFIGLVISENKRTKKFLTAVQKDLHRIMAHLSGAKTDLSFLNDRVKMFEYEISRHSKKLPLINNFILPQGSRLSCWFHILRSICRRAERSVVRYYEKFEIRNSKFEIIKYFNRLSDLFFVLARHYNNQKEMIIIKK